MSQQQRLNHILLRTRKSALAMMLKEFAGAPMVAKVEKAIEEERRTVAQLEEQLKSG